MMGKGRHHLVVFCDDASVDPSICGSSVSGHTDSSKTKLANLFSLMLTEINQMLLASFYFDLPSNGLPCQKQFLHACVAEEKIY